MVVDLGRVCVAVITDAAFKGHRRCERIFFNLILIDEFDKKIESRESIRYDL
jgi:hypothetical protein